MRTLYRDAGYANVEAEPETELDPVHEQVDIVVPIRRGPPVHIERIEVKGNTKTRDKVIRREVVIQEGNLFSETGMELSKRRITALGYFERVDVSTEQGSSPDKIIINFEVAEKPTGTFQVGAGFSSIESFIATAQVQQANLFGNGQSLALQAQVSALRQLVTLRFFEPYFLDSLWNASAELYDTLYVFPGLRAPQPRRVAHLRLRAHQPVAAPQPHRHRGVRTRSTRQPTSDTFFGATPGFVSIFQTAAAGEPLQLGPRRLAAADDHVRHARQPPLPDVRHLPPGVDGAARASTSAASSTTSATGSRGASTTPSAAATGPARLGLRLKLNTEVGSHHEPRPAGRAHLPALLPRRHPRRARLLPAQHRPAPAAHLGRSTPTRRPSRNGANIGGNLEAYENLELEFPIIDKVGIRGVVFFDAGNAWNTEQQFCKHDPGAPVRRTWCSPASASEQPGPAANVHRLRHPLVLAARAAALRVGLPAGAAAVREPLGLRVHDRQLLLIATLPLPLDPPVETD